MTLPAIHKKPLLLGLALALATIAFSQWGYFWYAMVFDDVWQSLIGHSELELIQLAERRGWVQTFNTYFISFVQASGLLALLFWSRVKSFFGYQAIAAICSLFIVVPALGNAVLFAGQSTSLWILDSFHFCLGYAGMALIFWISQSVFARFLKE